MAKVATALTYAVLWPAVPLPGIHPKEMNRRSTCHLAINTFTAVLAKAERGWGASRAPHNKELTEEGGGAHEGDIRKDAKVRAAFGRFS